MEPTATNRKLELTTPSDREIVMTRVFDASREMVFGAFTKPELIKRWMLGPDGWSMPECDVDLRPGGTFRWLWHKDDDSMEFGASGTFKRLERPESIVRTEKLGAPMETPEVLVTTTFVERGGTTAVTMTMLFGSREERDEALESGMEYGVVASYDRLADLLRQ